MSCICRRSHADHRTLLLPDWSELVVVPAGFDADLALAFMVVVSGEPVLEVLVLRDDDHRKRIAACPD